MRSVTAFALYAIFLASSAAHAGPLAIDLEFELVAGGLTQPLAARHAGDGSGRLFVVQRGGIIRVVSGDSLLAAPFLDLSVATGLGLTDTSTGERGLLGLDFHPEFGANRKFYVNYTDLTLPGRRRRPECRGYVIRSDHNDHWPGCRQPQWRRYSFWARWISLHWHGGRRGWRRPQ